MEAPRCPSRSFAGQSGSYATVSDGSSSEPVGCGFARCDCTVSEVICYLNYSGEYRSYTQSFKTSNVDETPNQWMSHGSILHKNPLGPKSRHGPAHGQLRDSQLNLRGRIEGLVELHHIPRGAFFGENRSPLGQRKRLGDGSPGSTRSCLEPAGQVVAPVLCPRPAEK